jgi:leucyl aminopeptidase (aminopeptidase T)
MTNLCEDLGILDARNIVFHSFRAFAANFIIDETGDFKAAQVQLGHSSIDTSWKAYVNKQTDVSQSAGILLDEYIDDNIFDKMTVDQMRRLLKETKNGVSSMLKRQAMKIVAEG